MENLRSRTGSHLFGYPFARRNMHTVIANLFAWRASRQQSDTLSMAVDDYGFELLSAAPIEWAAHLAALLLRSNARESLFCSRCYRFSMQVNAQDVDFATLHECRDSPMKDGRTNQKVAVN